MNAYLAVLGDAGTDIRAMSARVADALGPIGMRECYASGAMVLFGSDELATLPLPGGGILIGNLFTRDGNPVTESGRLLESPSPVHLRKYVLDTCWGSYLMIQPERQGAGSFTIMRSPAVAGNVPCVHSIREGAGFLTSDISLAIRANLYRKRIDWDAIARRLRYPGTKTQCTGLADVSELLPGCSLTLRGTEVSHGLEWSPWNHVAPERRYRDPHAAAAHIRDAVVHAVRAWSSVDHSILLELSGGLDSSIVAACLDGHRVRVCCNVVTPVPGADERHYAGLVAQQLGAELHAEHLGFDKARLEFAPTPDSVAPGMGPLQYAIDRTMEAAAERHGATSFYSGGGGDSVFCYLRTAAPAVDALRAGGLGAAIAATRDLAHLHQCTFWKAGRLALSKLRRPPGAPCRQNAAFLAPGTGGVVPEQHPWFAAPTDALPGDRERIFDLAGNQLFQGQAARGSRRPLRFPLLSQPVMEACLRTPSWAWIAGGRNRAAARAAFSGMLPPAILSRQSKATYMGYLGMLYQKNKSQIRGFLLSGRLASEGLLDSRAIEDFIAAALPPRDQAFLRMFELCMVENWVRHQP